jgi:hypothetical protein
VFERLLYTDCRAGHGRRGSDGFQIQAQSVGITSNLERLAVESLLYARQEQWERPERAVDDFPLGLAHASQDGWGTAQSRYLGRTSSLPLRLGNHLADCLLTTDREPYGAIRPAQLFGSDVWRDEPFDSIECPPFDGFLSPGPLTNDEVQEWLQEDGERPGALARLVSVLEQPDGPQVLIVADRTEEALHWIVAATILLPIQAALDVSFKVFVNDVNRSPQRVIGVLKELNPRVTPETAGGKFVIDATLGTSSTAETSKRAAYWVQRLLSAEDPYEVVEAVDFAQALEASGKTDPADARETAWLITADSEPLTSPDSLIRWLTQPKDASLSEQESAAATRLLDSGLADASTLNWIERQADASRLDVNRENLRRALLTAELAEVETSLGVKPEPLAPVDIGDGPRRDAESAISSAILLATDDGVVDRLLRIAERHSVPLALTPLHDRLSAFVSSWIKDPARHYDPAYWALSEPILQELVDQLTALGQGNGRSSALGRVRPLIAQAWPYLLQQVNDPLNPLVWELHAASIATSHGGAKPGELGRVLKIFASSAQPTEALTGFQQALVRWRALSRAEAMVLVTELPRNVRVVSELYDQAWAGVVTTLNRPDVLVLNTIWRLAEWRMVPTNEAALELLRADQQVATFMQAALELQSVRDLTRLPEIARVNPRVLRLRTPDLVETSLQEEALPLLGPLMVDELPLAHRQNFLEAWSSELAGKRDIIAAARGYIWSENPESTLHDRYRAFIAESVARHAQSLSPAERTAWISQIERRLSPDEADGFEPFLSGIKRHGNRLSRPKGPVVEESKSDRHLPLRRREKEN